MRRVKFILGILAIVAFALAIFFVLRSEYAVLIHPKGMIARSELRLIGINYLLMLVVVIPTFIVLFRVAWKYRSKNEKAKYDPEHSHGRFAEMLLWIVPSIIIAAMAPITWYATHELDPYKPIDSEVNKLKIQVVASDWKWLFIYPEQGIASVNFVQFPDKTPIHFELAADGSPMNSFWLPELSGQIYCMSGMITPLHIMADEPGVYTGRAAEINGEGFADMTFTAKSSSPSDFEAWVASAKLSPLQLTEPVYDEFLKPSMNHPIMLYSHVDPDLFNKIVMKYMHPTMPMK